MTPNEYQELAKRTVCSQDTAFQRIAANPEAVTLLHSVIGMAGELGELASCLEKWLWYGQPFDAVNFAEEWGDCDWYQAEALNAIKIKFEDVLTKNIAKLQKRYPEKYSDHLAAEVNRDRAAERDILEQSPLLSIDADDPKNWDTGDIKLGPSPLPEKRYVKVGQGISQTGQGFAEPSEEHCLNSAHISVDQIKDARYSLGELPVEDIPEVVILQEVPIALTAHFGDGLVRDQRDSSYNMGCGGCNKPIHRSNTSGLCPDCMADKLAGRPLFNETRKPNA
jgi:hypothetical protein